VPSLIRIEEKKEVNIVSVLISQRGNSRRKYCAYKPLRISFLDPKIDEFISAAFNEDFNPYRADFAKKYLYKLTELHSNANRFSFEPVSLKNGLFKNLGNDLKLVSHCGEGGFVGSKSPEVQAQKLLEEYYLYKIQNSLYSASLQTQLIEIDYLDKDEKHISTNFGFFREDFSQVAKRCGVKKKKEVSFETQKELDSNLAFQAEFLMKFHTNRDYAMSFGHNIGYVYKDDQTKLPIPYDFDLTGLVKSKNYDRREENRIYGNLQEFQHWLLKNPFRKGEHSTHLSRAVVNIENLLNKRWQIGLLIQQSIMKEESKEKFQNWSQHYIQELEKTLLEIKKIQHEQAGELARDEKAVAEKLSELRRLDLNYNSPPLLPNQPKKKVSQRGRNSSKPRNPLGPIDHFDLKNRVHILENQLIMLKNTTDLESLYQEQDALSLQGVDTSGHSKKEGPR